MAMRAPLPSLPPIDPRWPIPDQDAVVVRLTILGEPQTKGRARMAKNGHLYTPDGTRQAEESLSMLIRTGRRLKPDASTIYGVQASFHTSDYHRRDVDNMGKLVLDAGNGEAWIDDQHVGELLLKVERGDPRPRTELLVYVISRQRGYCLVCNAEFSFKRNGQRSSRQAFCSQLCSNRSRRGVPLTADVLARRPPPPPSKAHLPEVRAKMVEAWKLRPVKTHCQRGHPFSPENTYVHPVSGHRACRHCRDIWRKQRKQPGDAAGEIGLPDAHTGP